MHARSDACHHGLHRIREKLRERKVRVGVAHTAVGVGRKEAQECPSASNAALLRTTKAAGSHMNPDSKQHLPNTAR